MMTRMKAFAECTCGPVAALSCLSVCLQENIVFLFPSRNSPSALHLLMLISRTGNPEN